MRMNHGPLHMTTDATHVRLTPNQLEEILEYVAAHHPSPAQLAGIFRLSTQEAQYLLRTETGTHYQPHDNIQLGASKSGWDEVDQLREYQAEAMRVLRNPMTPPGQQLNQSASRASGWDKLERTL